MLTQDYLRLHEIFSPDVLWKVLPKRLLGKVSRKLANSTSGGFIKPTMEIMYPDGSIMEDIYSSELGDFSIGDFVAFSMRDARESEKLKKGQKDLQQAFDVEFATAEDIENFENNPQYPQLLLLGKQLEKIIKETEKEKTGLITQRAKIEEEIEKRTSEAIFVRNEDFARQERALLQRDAAIAKREKEIKESVEEKVAKRKSELDAQEKLLASREKELVERIKILKDQKSALESERQQLAQAQEKFRNEGGEKFVKIFSMHESSDFTNIAVASDAALPKNLHKEIQHSLQAQGFEIDDAVSIQFLLSALCAAVAGQFVVLSGPTGVGKTSMVNIFASTLGAGHGVVPVRPSWIDPTDLLGFYNPQTNRYQASPFMDRFLEARQYAEANRMYFLTLDEMNLSRIENYAADFLSRLEKARAGESESHLSLYSKDIERQLRMEIERLRSKDEIDLKSLSFAVAHLDKYPSSIVIPEGLVMFGTVNLDETAHHLSPKFLDRSFVVKIPSQELIENISEINNVDPNNKTLFDLTLNSVKNLFKEAHEVPSDVQRIWGDVLNWQDEYIKPLGIRLGFRFSQMYNSFMKIAVKLGITPRAASSVFFQAKLFPWISFHRDDKAVGGDDQFKLEVLQNWVDDKSLADYPEEFGLKSALQEILENNSGAIVVRYLE